MKWLVWRVVELLLRVQFRLTGALAPDEPIERDVYYTGQIYPKQDFFKAVRKGAVKTLRGACTGSDALEARELDAALSSPCFKTT